jgi:hypothetical protein
MIRFVILFLQIARGYTLDNEGLESVLESEFNPRPAGPNGCSALSRHGRVYMLTHITTTSKADKH